MDDHIKNVDYIEYLIMKGYAKNKLMAHRRIFGDNADLPFLEGYRVFDAVLFDDAIECWKKKDAMGMLVSLPNMQWFDFVIMNEKQLFRMGKYEEVLLNALVMPRVNLSMYSIREIMYYLELADPEKFKAAGDPIPKQESFTLYRGVSGKGPKRRVNGISWTDSPSIASWFAQRLTYYDPAVFKAEIPKENIMAYDNGRSESEYIVRLPLPKRPIRLKQLPEKKEGKSWKMQKSKNGLIRC